MIDMLIKGALELGGKFLGNEGDKQKFTSALEEIKLQYEKDLLNAQASVVTAELQQDDKYTKRARPTVIYAGLVLIFLEMFGVRMAILSLISSSIEVVQASNTIVMSFLAAWGGVVGMYTFGRTQEKKAGGK